MPRDGVLWTLLVRQPAKKPGSNERNEGKMGQVSGMGDE